MSLVQYAVVNRVGYLTLNRPEKRNALNYAFVQEIKAAFAKAEADDEAKVLVLKANGPAFCAGADLAYIQGLQHNTYEENLDDSNNLMELFRSIYMSKKVVISQIEGPAMAGGCGLATVCDFSFATPESLFAYTEAKIGFVPAIVMVFLIRKIGEGKAKELMLTAKAMKADKALAYGLINFVEAPETIAEAVRTFAEKLCLTTSGESLGLIKAMTAEVQNLSLEDGLDYAAATNAKARAGQDCQRGIAAFLNKEKIQW